MPCGYSSYACDKRCSYKTPVLVSILDWRLGCMKYSFMGLIFVYVIAYNIVYKCGYLQFEAPVGHVRFQLQQPTKTDPVTGAPCDPTENACEDDFTPLDQLSYCKQDPDSAQRPFTPYPCTFWDANQDVYMQSANVLMTTRVVEYNQTRQCSPLLKPGLPNATDCPKLWKNDKPNVEGVKYFVADVERYTLLLDHTVIAPSINVSASGRECQGHLKVTADALDPDSLCALPDAVAPDDPSIYTVLGGHEALCYLKPNTTYDSKTHNATGLDVFDLSVLLQAAGVELEEESPTNGHSVRYNGVTLVVNIRYQNWDYMVGPNLAFKNKYYNKGAGGDCAIPYEYELTSVPDSPAKRQSVEYVDYPDRRVLLNEHGIRLFVLQTGSLGDFQMAVLLIAITSSLTLLAVATTVVDSLAIYCLPEKKYYAGFKYPETPHVSELVEEEERREARDSAAVAALETANYSAM